MLAPLIVAEIVPARKARLLLESSQARPPSSRQSFQNATVNFNASTISFELMTTRWFLSTSAAPKHHVTPYAQLLGSPRLWPNACPMGRPCFLSCVPTRRSSSQVSGHLVRPASLNQSSRQFQVVATVQSGTAFHLPPTMQVLRLRS